MEVVALTFRHQNTSSSERNYIHASSDSAAAPINISTMVSSTLLLGGILAAATLSFALPPSPPERRGAGAIKCPVVLNGLVGVSLTPADFDSYATSPFNPDYVRGGEKFSQTLRFPAVAASSRFDNASTKAVEVTINDRSIFQAQNGFRRAGLQIQGDTNEGGPGTVGIRTLHFSVKQDPQRRLNLTHEYLNVWHETADYSANQFNFQAGTLIGRNSNKNTFKVLNRQNTEVWSTPIDETAWQNFAITLDFNKNTLQVYYSRGDEPLRSVTSALSNNNAGGGQYQIGILKKPTGTSDVVNGGYQEKNLDEGQIYGGLFLEDGANGCISL
ncbi:putative glycoside hydrolase family 131 protein [Rosellinia necatrix]|uniref:Putative glycoside hydrolase family 131 protein n=1 Tax=Rosellinia necatrix TaxID=77044 RepID=A0A1W2TTW1_ROSNE|nr:putative glycoside hydrolase family 131 protein [Rosellinia necatrix]